MRNIEIDIHHLDIDYLNGFIFNNDTICVSIHRKILRFIDIDRREITDSWVKEIYIFENSISMNTCDGKIDTIKNYDNTLIEKLMSYYKYNKRKKTIESLDI